MTAIHPVDMARAGARAVEDYFQHRKIAPVTAGDGRYVVYVPGNGQAVDLQLTLAATPAARGVLARVKARRTVAPADWGRAMTLANKWNRSCPLPHVTLSARGTGADAVGAFLVEAALPQAPEYSPEQMSRFIDTVLVGARQFWSGDAVAAIARPWETPAEATSATATD